jgi:adenosylcobyric acid synthase
MARALHIMGTTSHAGKSVLTAAFGAWLRERGLGVAPFKAQNMSLNSFVTLAGEEVARSQAAQAEVLGLEVTADMNPILLKPLDHGCQVVVQGRGVGVMSIHEYYAYKAQAWRAITESYGRLATAHEAVVLEGAGSPVEINLKANDLVNLRMAAHAGASIVLVADIERGGAFAQLVGTWELLEPAERDRVVGLLLNKFRGDPSLLDPGLAHLHRHTGRPVLGVLPYDPAVQLEEEDSLALDGAQGATAEVDVAVVRLPGISNFTDLAPLARAPNVAVRYVTTAPQLERPDLLVLPGTRTTVRALAWLRATGLADAVVRLAAATDGPIILGLCGGYQLLGRTIGDPDRVESAVVHAEGLGLLEVDTRFEPRKTLCRVEATVTSPGLLGYRCPIVGYEVHQGTSQRRDGTPAWLHLRRQAGGEVLEGATRSDGRVYGTYVHGIFDDARFCRAVVAELRRRRGLAPLTESAWRGRQSSRCDLAKRLATWLREHCDLHPVAAALGIRAD